MGRLDWAKVFFGAIDATGSTLASTLLVTSAHCAQVLDSNKSLQPLVIRLFVHSSNSSTAIVQPCIVRLPCVVYSLYHQFIPPFTNSLTRLSISRTMGAPQPGPSPCSCSLESHKQQQFFAITPHLETVPFMELRELSRCRILYVTYGS